MANTQRSNLLITNLLVCLCLTQFPFFLPASFLPNYVLDHFPSVSSFKVGVLFSLYPVAYLVTCPFVAHNLDYLGRKNCFIFGFQLMGFSTALFGLASYCQSSLYFFSISGVARILQGTADAIVCVSIPSIITTEYP